MKCSSGLDVVRVAWTLCHFVHISAPQLRSSPHLDLEHQLRSIPVVDHNLILMYDVQHWLVGSGKLSSPANALYPHLV